MSAGFSDLQAMLASLDATIRPDEYVFAIVPPGHPAVVLAQATVFEDEGLTVVLPRDDADRLDISYDFVAAWLTLTVHSSLTAVGLTAAFSRSLSEAGISCNVLAGFHHDHLLVPAADRQAALDVIRALRTDASGQS